jgi:hypothetical protein
MFFDLEYHIDGKRLAPKSIEKDPTLVFWTSTIPNWTGVVETKVNWDTDEEISASGKIRLPFKVVGNQFAYDDSIGIRLVVKTPNHESFLCNSQAGNVLVFIRNILARVKADNGTFATKEKIILRSLNENIHKANITIILTNGNDLRGYTVAEKTPFSVCDENQMLLATLCGASIIRELKPFSTKEEVSFIGLYKEATKMHDSFWSTELDVPGIMYWVNFIERTFQEEFMDNLLLIALERRNMTLREFVGIVNRQFATKKDTVNDEFIEAQRILGDITCILSTSLRYKSDETYRSKRGTKKNRREEEEEDHIILELFLDAYTYLSGDCEDTANLAHDIFRKIRNGMKVHANDAIAYRKHGGWSSEGMNALQKIAFQYIGCGTLGIVTSRWLSENDGKRTKSSVVIIDSDDDKNVELGGHMYYMMLPIPFFERCLRNLNKKGEPAFHIYEEGVLEPWSNSLQVMVGEGTGLMDPFLKPRSEYYKSEEMRKQVMKETEYKVNLLMEVAKRSFRMKKSEIMNFQVMIRDVDNARLSKFYRFAVSFTTDLLLQEGYDVAKFIWITDINKRSQYRKSHLIPELDDEEDDKCSWRVGANMRDIIYKMEHIGLFAVPGLTDNEIRACKSKLRHFMPNRSITIDNKMQLEQKYKEMLRSFEDKLNVIFQDKASKESQDEVKKLFEENRSFDIILRGNEAFDDQTQKDIMGDVIRFKEILGCKIFIEVVTDLVVNVRLRFFCKMVNNAYPAFDYELETRSQKKNEGKNESETRSDDYFEDIEESMIYLSDIDVKSTLPITMENQFCCPVLVQWEDSNSNITKLYEFPDDGCKEEFISELIETTSHQTDVVNNLGANLARGAKFAQSELQKFKGKVHKLMLSGRDEEKFKSHKNYHTKVKSYHLESNRTRHRHS